VFRRDVPSNRNPKCDISHCSPTPCGFRERAYKSVKNRVPNVGIKINWKIQTDWGCGGLGKRQNVPGGRHFFRAPTWRYVNERRGVVELIVPWLTGGTRAICRTSASDVGFLRTETRDDGKIAIQYRTRRSALHCVVHDVYCVRQLLCEMRFTRACRDTWVSVFATVGKRKDRSEMKRRQTRTNNIIV